VEEIIIEENAPIPVLQDIIRKINSIIDRSKNHTIKIDMTTPIKWHLLIFLRLLDSIKLLNHVRFLYTEPRDYYTDLFQPLSFGISDIFPIPLFSGNYDFSKNDLLVLMLGYEGSRALAIYEKVDPTEVLLLISNPPYHPEWKGRTEEMNKEIINIVGHSKIKYLDSRNPLLITNQLYKILSGKEYLEYNHIVSPLGTKPQILGLYSYISLSSIKPIVLYGKPLRHNHLFYSYGIGKTWELKFERSKLGKKYEN